jgi:CHAD domain-containing protein
MREEERKYEVPTGFTVPDLSALGTVAAKSPKRLEATYYDTADLRLARAGVSLRYRRGDALPWTVKLPSELPGVRDEISRSGSPDEMPPELLDLTTVWHRGEPVAPAAVVRTNRRVYVVTTGSGDSAEIADDDVSVLRGKRVVKRFREVEVEHLAGARELLDSVEERLVEAGAAAGGFTPKHVRALGEAAAAPPDAPPPKRLRRRKATAGEVAIAAIRADVGRIIAYDPLVRLRSPVGEDDTAVHQMRVGCRRLRSDLRTFELLLDRAWLPRLRTELAWLADLLGGARDAEVLRARLRVTASADPLAPLDSAAVARVDADLAARHEDALVALDQGLSSKRYLSLVDALVSAATAPPLTALAAAPASEVLPRLVGRPWQRFAYGKSGMDGADDLDPEAPDDAWHDVRIRGKRARYALDAVAPLLGGPAAALASALGKVQNLLGEHQDAAVAAETWLRIARSDPEDHMLAVTAGRLYERERAAIRAVRAAFPAAWRAASRRRLTAWL